MDGNGTAGEAADDAWDFGLANDHPILKFGGLAASHQLAAQPPAPSFGSRAVSNKDFPKDFADPAVPDSGGRPSGNGALTLRGQRACRRASSSTPTARRSCPGNAPRMVCGTPTATTTAPVTVTITVSDSDDGNEDSTDEDDLTFTVEVVGALGGDLLPGGAWRRRP